MPNNSCTRLNFLYSRDTRAVGKSRKRGLNSTVCNLICGTNSTRTIDITILIKEHIDIISIPEFYDQDFLSSIELVMAKIGRWA